jgi:hypothetical protein
LQTILSEPGMESLNNGSITFPSVANQPQYAVPQAVARIKTVYETTNKQKLTPQSLEWYRAAFPDVSTVTGTPNFYVDLGFSAVSQQPSNASQLLIDSTSASDTGTAYIEGYRTGGFFRSTSIAMTGVTAVNLGPSDFLFITKLYLSAAAVGTVTLVEDAEGGTVLATIPIGQTFSRHRAIALVPTSAAVVTYTADFEYDVPDMANAKDEPILPPRFHRMLAVGARMRDYEKQNDAVRYAIAEKEFDVSMRKLKFYILSQAAGQPNLRGNQAEKPSQLGGAYPAGT